jgi:hypothetical protein
MGRKHGFDRYLEGKRRKVQILSGLDARKIDVFDFLRILSLGFRVGRARIGSVRHGPGRIRTRISTVNKLESEARNRSEMGPNSSNIGRNRVGIELNSNKKSARRRLENRLRFASKSSLENDSNGVGINSGSTRKSSLFFLSFDSQNVQLHCNWT